MALGIGTLLLSIFAGIPAIICGHIARAKIKASQGRLTGSGLALGGLILGYLSVAIIVVLSGLAVPVALKAIGKANQISAISEAGLVKGALDRYADDHGGDYPLALADLAPKYLLVADLTLSEGIPLEEGTRALIYVPGLTKASPGDRVILYSDGVIADSVVIIRQDNSSSAVAIPEFINLAYEQGLSHLVLP